MERLSSDGPRSAPSHKHGRSTAQAQLATRSMTRSSGAWRHTRSVNVCPACRRESRRAAWREARAQRGSATGTTRGVRTCIALDCGVSAAIVGVVRVDAPHRLTGRMFVDPGRGASRLRLDRGAQALLPTARGLGATAEGRSGESEPKSTDNLRIRNPTNADPTAAPFSPGCSEACRGVQLVGASSAAATPW